MSVLKFFCSVFYQILTEYGDFHSKYPYLVQKRENTDQKNSRSENLLCSVYNENIGLKRVKSAQSYFVSLLFIAYRLLLFSQLLVIHYALAMVTLVLVVVKVPVVVHLLVNVTVIGN